MSFLDYQKQNPEFLNNYLKYQRFIRGNSQTTVDETYVDLRTLFRYVKLFLYDKSKIDTITPEEFKKIDIKDVTIDNLSRIKQADIDKYLLFLKNKLNNNAKTRNRKLASTKDFFKYLFTTNLIASEPTRGMKFATIEKRNPKYLNLDESKKLLSTTINSDQLYKIRNYAITCLFLNCCLRLSELTKIDITDIKLDESEQTLKVHGKDNKERLLYLNPAVCEAIKEYLKIRADLGKDNLDCNALFLSSRNKRISKRMVQTIIKTELEQTLSEEKSKDFHTHSLRHTGPTLLYEEKNVNIFVLKAILGHESLTSTEIYTHVSDKKLKEIMENCTISSILEKRKV